RKVMLALLSGLLVLAPLGAVSAAPSPQAQKWAVVIGISEYEGRTQSTPGSAGDAAIVREALLRNGWPDDHIKVLVNEAATADAIRSALAWLVEVSTDDGFAVFSYSGHVKQKPNDQARDGDQEGNDEFIWPTDNLHIADGELARYLRDVKGDFWVNIAGCEAAGFDDGVSGPRTLFTAASQEDQKGYERGDWRQSVFNGLMVDQALLNGAGDADGDRAVSIHEAFDHAAREAPEMTKDQRFGPQNPYIAGGDGTPWFLSPPAPPRAEASSGGDSGVLGGLLGGLLG
ncbi:MAG: caspase family protein, partial [Actinomycetota bacterium]|nr:caspase family protein [Actinomycetota bacterium]